MAGRLGRAAVLVHGRASFEIGTGRRSWFGPSHAPRTQAASWRPRVPCQAMAPSSSTPVSPRVALHCHLNVPFALRLFFFPKRWKTAQSGHRQRSRTAGPRRRLHAEQWVAVCPCRSLLTTPRQRPPPAASPTKPAATVKKLIRQQPTGCTAHIVNRRAGHRQGQETGTAVSPGETPAPAIVRRQSDHERPMLRCTRLDGIGNRRAGCLATQAQARCRLAGIHHTCPARIASTT